MIHLELFELYWTQLKKWEFNQKGATIIETISH